jgi:predicted lysophospholipase L1 biosynthesis ABC-type transport system permease subunit
VAAVFALEFLWRGAAASVTALMVGPLAAWAVVHRGMDLPFQFPAVAVGVGLAAATGLLTLLSLFVSLPALRTPPMEVLRYE